VGASALGGSEGILIAAEAVVQHCGHPLGKTDRSVQAPGCRILDAGLDLLQRRSLLAAPSGEEERRVPEGGVPGCLGDRVSLIDQRGCSGELSGEHVQACAVSQRVGKDGKRAGIASQSDRASGELVPGRVVPQFGR
jgi:hypothetical protein